jgi:putative endonuclease
MNWAKGQNFENIATDYMIQRGFCVLDRNWHAGKYGELDLICKKSESKKDILVFIEVKGRNSTCFEEDGLNAINQSKAKKLIHSIQAYQEHYEKNHNECNYEIRFDLILVSSSEQVIHLENISLIDFIS